MNFPPKGVKGTSVDALSAISNSEVLISSDEEMDSTGHQREAEKTVGNVDVDKVMDESQQKTETIKFFNLDSDKYNNQFFYVYIEKTNDQQMGRLHPMYVGHILHKSLNIKNILSIKSVGKNRIKVQVKTAKDANNLVNNKFLAAENLKAFIPGHLLEKKGLIRGVDTRFDNNYLKENIKSSSVITNIYRTQKKVEKDNDFVWVPRQTIIVTFEGNMLPAAISINSVLCPVEPYMAKVIQCFKCLKYGHVASQCRSTTTLCMSCSKEKNENHSCNNISYCLYCKNSKHSSTSKNCPMFEKQKKIKKIMAERNLSFREAKDYAESNFANSLTNNRFSVLSNLNYNIDFPSLPNTQLPTTYSSQPSPITHTKKIPDTSSQKASTNSRTVNKKRKINPSPVNSPPITPMFPFRFGEPVKALSGQTPTNVSYPSIQPETLETISNFIINLFKKVTCIDDIRKINNEAIVNDLKMVLGDTNVSD